MRRTALLLLVALATMLPSPPVDAGGPRKTNVDGDPILWDTSTPVGYFVDQGTLGTLSNDAANQLVADAYRTWEEIPQGTKIRFLQLGQWPVNITGANYLTAVYPSMGDGVNLIVYDNDGSVLEAALGDGAQDDILGITGYDLIADGELKEVSVILNGLCFDGNGDPNGASPCEAGYEEFRGVVVHELGHFAGLDHSDLNRRFVFDGLCSNNASKTCRNDTDCGAGNSCNYKTSNNAVLPTMYPIATENDTTLPLLHLDDQLALARLYPPDGFPGALGILQGQVFKSDGTTLLNGANVVLRNLEDPNTLAVSAVSGDVRPPGAVARDGYFRFEGLPKGNYTLEVRPIAAAFGGPRSVGQFGQCKNDATLACWCDPSPGCNAPACCASDSECSVPGGDCDPLHPPLFPGPSEFLSEAELTELANAELDLSGTPRILKVSDNTMIVSPTPDTPDGIDVVVNDLSTLGDDFAGTSNDLCAQATPVPTAGGILGDRIVTSDVDFFQIDVPAGWRLRVDVDAQDGGLTSTLNPEIRLREGCGVDVAVTTPIADPATGLTGADPAVEYVAPVDQTVTIEVTGADDSTGPYLLRLDNLPPVFSSFPRIVAAGGAAEDSPLTTRLLGGVPASVGGTASGTGIKAEPLLLPGPFADNDLDGIPDGSDLCPGSGDGDGDGVCDDLDNCVAVANATQRDGDSDGAGDRCDSPRVIAEDPLPGSFSVPKSASITVIFSEPIQTDMEDTANVALKNASSALVPSVNLPGANDTKVTIDPIDELLAEALYSVTLDNLLDTDGQLLDLAPFTFLFTTLVSSTAAIQADDFGAGYEGHEEQGSASMGRYGASVASGADVNGDGFRDAVVGAPYAGGLASETRAGRVTILFGDGGAVEQSSTATLDFVGSQAEDRAGTSISFVRDLNGDGYDELLIGAPGDTTTGGKAYLVFGREDLASLTSPIDLSTIDDFGTCNPCGVTFVGTSGMGDGDRAGTAVSAAGDFNNDDVPDFMIGAPGADPMGRIDAGIVYVVYGSDSLEDPGTFSLSQVGSIPGTQIYGEFAGDRAGSALSDWKDRQFDGIDDLLIGAPTADVERVDDPDCYTMADAGLAYALLGRETPYGMVVDLRNAIVDPGNTPSRLFLGTEEMGAAGFAVWGRGDVDGDGENDVLIGAPGMQFGVHANAGIAYVIPSLKDDDPIKDEASEPEDLPPASGSNGTGTLGCTGTIRRLGGPTGCSFPTPGSSCSIELRGGFFAGGAAADDQAGFSMATASDLNGDGMDEILVGAPGADVSTGGLEAGVMVDAGKVYLLFGQASRSPGEEELAKTGISLSGVVIEGVTANGHLGEATTGTGDLDDSGTGDLLLGAPSDGATGNGSAFIAQPFVSTETRNLRLSKSPDTTLEWDETPASIWQNGSNKGYAVFQGNLSDLAAEQKVNTYGTNPQMERCIVIPPTALVVDADGDDRPDFVHTAVPPPGQGFWYLVAGTNDFGIGPLGVGDESARRTNNRTCECPVQPGCVQ